ncbi:hypothetical protein PG987_007666 [Apiospora arundinis]
MATEEMEANPFGGDGSNWTLLWVIVFSIPFIFFAIAVYSTWKDRRTVAAKEKSDLETGRAAKIDRYFHPWKYPQAESSTARQTANHRNLTIVTTTATTASTAAGATSRHSREGITSSRGRKNSIASITPWFAQAPQDRVNPYRPAHYQQPSPQQPQPQQQSSQQSRSRGTASPYLPRPVSSMYDETEPYGDGSDLRYV